MGDYMKRLSIHPGMPIATAMTVVGAIAGAQEGGTTGALAGAAAFGLVCWVPVLITARTQPLPKQERDR